MNFGVSDGHALALAGGEQLLIFEMIIADKATRRAFLAGSAASAAICMAQKSSGQLTAGQVIERIKANVGIPWRAQTVPVTFIAAAEPFWLPENPIG